MEKLKTFSIRLPQDLHRLSKVEAFQSGMSMQSWMIVLIKNELKKKNEKQS